METYIRICAKLYALDRAETEGQRIAVQKQLDREMGKLERSIAVYRMINLRTDGQSGPGAEARTATTKGRQVGYSSARARPRSKRQPKNDPLRQPNFDPPLI